MNLLYSYYNNKKYLYINNIKYCILLIKKIKYLNNNFKFIFYIYLNKYFFLIFNSLKINFFEINYKKNLKKKIFIKYNINFLNYINSYKIFKYLNLKKNLNYKEFFFFINYFNFNLKFLISIYIIKQNNLFNSKFFNINYINKTNVLKNLYTFNQNEIIKNKLTKNIIFYNNYNNYIYFLENNWFKILIYYKNIKFILNKLKLNKNNSIKYFHKNIFFNFNLLKNKKYYISNSPKKKEIFIQTYINLNFKQYWILKKKFFNLNLPLTTKYKFSFFFPLTKFIKFKDIISGLEYIENIFETKYSIYFFPISNLIGIIIILSTQIFDKISKKFFFKIGCDFGYKQNISWNFGFNYKSINILSKKTEILYGGFILSENRYSFNYISENFFKSSLYYNSISISTKNTFIYCFNLILESVIKQYNLNGIYINSMYFELIIKRMLSCIKIQLNFDNIFFFGDKIKFTIINLINISLNTHGYILYKYKPIILGITKANLICSGFLTSISFQETIKLLIEASIIKKVDWFTDLKSQVICSDLITSGSGWYKNFNII